MNLFSIRVFIGLLMTGLLPTFMFFFFLLGGYSIVWGIVVWMIMIMLCMMINWFVVLRHPLMDLMKGAGLLAMTIDSTGVIEPFIVKVGAPFIKGRLANGSIATSVFDRNTIFYTKAPRPAQLNYDSRFTDPNYDHYDFAVPKGRESSITFAFQQWPTLIYNKNMGTFLTKDALSKIETESMIKHLVIYLKVKTEELTSIMRDFARYVIEMTKPKTSFLEGKGRLFLIIGIAILIVILVGLFGPSLIGLLGGFANGARSALGSAAASTPGSLIPAK